MHPTERDGPYCYDDNMAGLPNYWPNSFLNSKADPKYKEHRDVNVSGDVDRHDSSNDDNFEQVTDFWTKVLTPEERERLANNIGGHLVNAQPFIQERAISNFEKVHPDFGAKIRLAIKKSLVCLESCPFHQMFLFEFFIFFSKRAENCKLRPIFNSYSVLWIKIFLNFSF